MTQAPAGNHGGGDGRAGALAGTRGVLLDLDGTVFVDGRPIPGAPEAVAELASRGLAVAFATNTTSRPRRVLSAELAAMGIPAPPGRILNPAAVAAAWLAESGRTRAHLLVESALLEDLPGLVPVEAGAQAVVVGDVAAGFTWERLNEAFQLLLAGAPLVALARNRCYLRGGRLVLDCGPFVAALEYASGKEAFLLGKPAPRFFATAFGLLGLPAADVVVVGDDLEGDVGGAQAAGARGVLVRTGKQRDERAPGAAVTPDLVVDSLASLPSVLR